MLKCNSQISLVAAQLRYWPPAASDGLALPADCNERAEHGAKLRKFLDCGQVQARPPLLNNPPIIGQRGIRRVIWAVSARNAATGNLCDIGRRDAVTGHFPIEGHEIDT